jgi:hypothetical protein
MPEKIIHTNTHLKNPKDRLERVARSAAVSAGIENIEISLKETREMAKKNKSQGSALRK